MKSQYNSCYCLFNVFPPFFIFIIVIFPDKINVSLIFPNRQQFFKFSLKIISNPQFYAVSSYPLNLPVGKSNNSFFDKNMKLPYRSKKIITAETANVRSPAQTASSNF